MSPIDIETILKFYMSKLPEAELAELDAMLTGDAPDEPAMASDSAIKRRALLALDARARVALRKHASARNQSDAAARAEYEAAFPHAARLNP